MDKVEILNPMHPVTEKLTMFVKSYLNGCLSKEELKGLSDRFDATLGLLRQVVESSGGDKLDAMIGMWAGLLAGKWKLPYASTMFALVFIENQLRNVIRRNR